jgi:hypothetical protein
VDVPETGSEMAVVQVKVPTSVGPASPKTMIAKGRPGSGGTNLRRKEPGRTLGKVAGLSYPLGPTSRIRLSRAIRDDAPIRIHPPNHLP